MCTEKCFGSKSIARVLLSLLFIVNGIYFLTHFSATAKIVTGGLSPLGLTSLVTFATLFAVIAQLGGGLMLAFNYRTSVASWTLIVFMTLATLMYHRYWGGDGGHMQMMAALENLAVIGGLLHYAKCCCKTCREKCEGKCTGDSCCKETPPTA